jgi:hypothetical protein
LGRLAFLDGRLGAAYWLELSLPVLAHLDRKPEVVQAET